MISGSKRQPSKSQSASSTSSTAGRNLSRTKGSSTASSTLQTKGKTQSQEDLTKGKEKTSTGRNKSGNGRTSSASTRRLAASSKDSSGNRGAGDAKSRDKTAAFKTSASSGGPTTKTSSNLSNSKTSMTQSRKNMSRAKIESDRNAMESQIKVLETQSKSKDSQIKALKQQLDQMMVLLEKNKQQGVGEVTNTSSDDGGGGGETAKFSSLVKLMGEDDSSCQLQLLQEENFKLKGQIDEMLILQSTSKKQQKSEKRRKTAAAADDASSNEEGLSSSMEDIDSAASIDLVIRSSTSVSRSTSTENLLDETNSAGSNPYLTLSGLSKMAADNGGGSSGGGADDNSESEKVACLTVRIQQMEESHISTNEELEATVQELNDLQKSIPELTIDNDRLKREQNILMERLETSEKKLSEKQTESEHLRALVSDHLNDDGNHNDLKQQYVRLLNERRRLLEYQDSLSAELRRWEDERKESQEIMGDYLERVRISERDLKQANTDKIILEKKLKDTKESVEEENSQEIQRLRDELKSERQRIDDLLRMREGCENDDFVGIVDNLRRDKQELEEKYMLLDDEYRDCQHENDKLDARVANLEEELEATGAKAKKDSSELSELIDHLNDEIRLKDAKLEEANETIFIMEDSVEQQIAVQKHERHTIQQLQNQISNLKEERVRLMKEIQQSKKEQRHKTEEWKQFQIDMQMAVSIANDMRAETQAEVAKLREEKQILEDTVTKIRVENEQLRRKRVSSVSMHSAAILEAVNRRQQGASTATTTASHNVDGNTASAAAISLHENVVKSRRNAEPSPGVQSLIKSFDSQSGQPTGRSNSTSVSPVTTPVEQQPPNTSANPANTQQQSNEQANNNSTFKIQTMKVGPSIATISPIQRHHSLSSISSPTASSFAAASSTSKLQGAAGGSSAGSSNSSKTGTPDSTRTGGSDLSQLSSYLRRNSTADTRKPPSSLDVNRSNSSVSEMLDHRMQQQTQQQQSTPTNTQTSTSSTGEKQRTKSASSSRGLANGNDPLVTLARKYGGSKRNALLQWCQKKTKDYAEIDITNFSTSWSDGLALCALMHSYLPAHIPYNSLVTAYASTNEERQRKLLQAKHFRLAFAAAESVGIEPTLSVDSMTLKERPDWQSVMYYVTQLYKYFET